MGRRGGGLRSRPAAPVYKADKLPDLRNLPIPRKDLFKGKTTLNAGVVQTSRGCPLGCGYCTVTTLYGREYRTRPVEAVVEEIRRYPSKAFLIVDDNVFLSHAYAHELFEALIPLRIKWGSQASLELACRDKSLLRLAARAGCVSLFVGIESLDQDTLNAAHKRFNHVAKYEAQLATLRRLGSRSSAHSCSGSNATPPPPSTASTTSRSATGSRPSTPAS